MARKNTKKRVKKTVVKTAPLKPKTKEESKFEVDQLRKDKIIYALESISTTLAALLFWITLNINIPRQFAQEARNLYNLGFVIALLYWIFTVFGNTNRLIKIKKLERELTGK